MVIHDPEQECFTEHARRGSSGTSKWRSSFSSLALYIAHFLGSRTHVPLSSFSRILRFKTACLLVPTGAFVLARLHALPIGDGNASKCDRFDLADTCTPTLVRCGACISGRGSSEMDVLMVSGGVRVISCVIHNCEETGETGLAVGSMWEETCTTGNAEGAGGAGARGGVISTKVGIDSCSFYESLVKVHRTETLTLAFQLSENSMISRNSPTQRISRLGKVQRLSPKIWCFRVLMAMMPHE